GGSNFINYNNPQVDKLIDEARETMDKPARIKVLKKVYKMIAEDYPYAFLFNDDTLFYAHTKHMKRAKDTYNYGVGITYWWIEE
ncbi:MAG: peptide ABC transporter substrate-binding protein, partial [Bdellovibrio sp. CG_4_9_14_3_um_filter_39_7]